VLSKANLDWLHFIEDKEMEKINDNNSFA